MSAQPDLRVALAGFGLAGSVFHAPLIAATPGLRVATIVTSNAERAERARAEYPEARVESSVEAVWARASEHDLVVIATANDAHAELATAAINLGLPVVVDKPLAPRSDDAKALIELAEATGVPLTVFHNRRWDSDFLTAKRLLTEGRLGEVHRLESRFERWRPEAPAGAWRFAVDRAGGGGVLLDLGTHLVDQALELFGPVAEVQGEARRVRGGPADDDVFIALRHASGQASHIWASEVAPEAGPRLRLVGSGGAFVVDQLDGQEAALRAGRRPGGGESWGVEERARWGRVVRGEDTEAIEPERGRWPSFYEGVAAALCGGGEMPVSPRDALAVLRILERVEDA